MGDPRPLEELELPHLERIFFEGEGTEILFIFRPATVAHQILQDNQMELIEFLSRYRDPDIADEEWSNEESFQKFNREAIRLLHNYVAAVQSLVEHTRNAVRELQVSEEFAAQYQDRVHSDFAASPVGRFVQDLRDFVLHKDLPQIWAQRGTAKPHRDVVLDADSLGAWDGWSSAAKEYLRGKKRWISLLDAVEEYGVVVERFQAWLDARLHEVYRHAFEQRDRARELMREKREEAEVLSPSK